MLENGEKIKKNIWLDLSGFIYIYNEREITRTEINLNLSIKTIMNLLKIHFLKKKKNPKQSSR